MASPDLPTLVLGPPTTATLFQTLFLPFVKEGLRHLLTGFDHLLFLLALLVATPRVKTMLGLVTTFTLAHSLTLAISALGVFSLSPRVAEPLIALTLCLVAAVHLFRPPLDPQASTSSKNFWWDGPMVFAFGLIHGFGFAAALRETMPPGSRLIPLLAFNLGIEAGQIWLVVAIFPLLFFLRRRPWYRWVGVFSSLLVGMAGLVWFVLRII